ncbi:YceI family protein [Psychroserpens sp.]|uniref:YceI family protein n=1 Tax=Psychroserpens sp. TaxID=2020870 RepID=UPI00385C49D8
MRTFKHILQIIIITLTITVNAQALKLNEKQSELSWTGKAAFNSYSLTGSIKVKEGAIEIKDNTLLSLVIVIDMKSLNHENSDLKSHLKNKDFFEVNAFPVATFKLSKPVIINNNEAILIGQMTIKNISKEETIKVLIINNTITLNHSIDRTSYGVKFNSPSFFKKMKENAIADEFAINGKLYFE